MEDLSCHPHLFQPFNSSLTVTYPSFLQLSFTFGGLGRCHSVQAPVRAFVIVKLHSNFNGSLYFPDSLEYHSFKQFILYGIVHTLGYRIILGISTLCHAYAYLAIFQTARISIAGILYTTIGVMD